MCFSATASFLTAGATGLVGLVALARAHEPRALALAATPALFAVQQGVEGLLWLTLPLAQAGSTATGLTYLFLFFSQVLWPVYAPLAVLLIEPDARRRQAMRACAAVGLAVGAYMVWWILALPHGAVIRDGHVVYVSESAHSYTVALAYLVATGLAPILSTQRTVVALGAIILVGSAVAYGFYREAFVSVWCFFAAAASVVILFHFQRAYRRRLRIAAV